MTFASDRYIPEYSDVNETLKSNNVQFLQFKYSNVHNSNGTFDCPNYTQYCNIMGSGRLKYLDGSNDYNRYPNAKYFPSRHYTLIFNTFVMMQIGNFFNARKLQDEINIFIGLTSNYLFPVIILIVFCG